MHSHDFKNAEEHEGQSVLIVGTGYSADDIGLNLYKFGAKHIIFSYRHKPMPYTWPNDPKCKFTTVPIIKFCQGKEVTFIDG